MTTPSSPAPRLDATATAPTVTAVVVTQGPTDFLDDALAALAAQDHRPDHVLVVDVDPGRGVEEAVVAAWPTGDRPVVVDAPGTRTFGGAVRRALAARPTDDDWLWLLHDDAAARPDALGVLLRAVEIAPSVAVAGCKQVDWDDPELLLEVGVSTSRFGRRMTGLDDAEVDQGQHDGREDVLAVGLAGALVRRDVWDLLGGPDPSLGPYGDGLDLCRRARLAGHRVVVVPGAAVRHAAASLRPGGRPGWDARRSAQARREAFLRAQLVGVPLPLVPVVAALALVSSVLRAGMRLAVKEPHLVIAELLAPWVVLSRPGRLVAARRSAARASVVRRGVLRPLQQDLRSVLRQLRDRRLAAAEARRTRVAPSELELRELAALRTRRRAGLAVVLLAAAGITLATLGRAVSGVLAGGRMTGGDLAFGDAGLAELWRAAGSWWVRADLGHLAAPDPLLAVLVPGTAVLGTLGRATAAVVLGALVLAAAGAWFAAGAATRSITLRAWAAATWTAAPALLWALTEVRLGALLTHVALPWAVLGVARALGVARVDAVASGLVDAQRTARRPAGSAAADRGLDAEARDDEHPDAEGTGLDPGHADVAGADAQSTPAAAAPTLPDHAEPSLAAAAGAGLALCLVTAGTPALLPAVLLAVLGAWVLRPRRRLGWAVVPPLILHGPSIASVVVDPSTWRALLVPPGTSVQGAVAPAWQQLLGLPSAPPAQVGWLAWLPGAVLIVVAALALAAAPPAVRSVRLGWFVAALGLGTAVALGRVPVTVADGAVTTAWSGGALSLAASGLLLAALVGAGGVRRALSRIPFGWRHVGAAVLATLALAGPLVLLGGWTVAVRGQAATGDRVTAGPQVTDAPSVPAVASQLQTSPARLRVLVLEPGVVVRATLLAGDGPQLLATSRVVAAGRLSGPAEAPSVAGPDAAEQALASTVADLTVGASGVVSRLAQLGVGAVLLPPGGEAAARTELAGRLDATLGLERVTETPAGVIWRVSQDVAGEVAWARLVRGSTAAFGEPLTAVPAQDGAVRTTIPAGDPDRLLVLAERADDGWRAWLDGVPLRAVVADWRQGFEVGAGGGELVVRHEAPARRPWLAVQLVVLGATGLLAVPVRRRRAR